MLTEGIKSIIRELEKQEGMAFTEGASKEQIAAFLNDLPEIPGIGEDV